MHDSDVLQPETVRQGGLVRSDMVSDWFFHHLVQVLIDCTKQHTFMKPNKPLEPPTPRTSVLGLDRLAKEKRAAIADEGSRKKAKYDDDGNEPVFKGACVYSFQANSRTDELYQKQYPACQFVVIIYVEEARTPHHTQGVLPSQLADAWKNTEGTGTNSEVRDLGHLYK